MVEYLTSVATTDFLVLEKKVPTNLSVAVTPASILEGDPFTISGYLTDNKGDPLAGATINLTATGTSNINWSSPTTDANGFYSIPVAVNEVGSWTVQAAFLGSSTLQGASAQILIGTTEGSLLLILLAGLGLYLVLS